MLDYSDIKDSVHKGSYSDPTPLPSSLSPPRLMIASSPFSPCRALFLGYCSIRLPRDRVASAPYWYHLLPVPPVYVPIYSSHVGFGFAPANEITLVPRSDLSILKSDKISRHHPGNGICFLLRDNFVPFLYDLEKEYFSLHCTFQKTLLLSYNVMWFYCSFFAYDVIFYLIFGSHMDTLVESNSADSFRRLDVDTFRHPGTSQRSVRRLSLTLFPSGRGAATIRGLPRRTKTLPRALRRRLPPRRPNRMARLQRDRPRAVRARAESAASFTARGPDALPPRARQRASTSRRR
ncbi:unnamed protein product [Musa acuminata subsp. burmannicoides]